MGHKRVSPKLTHKGHLMFGRNINSTVNYIIAIDKNNCAHAVRQLMAGLHQVGMRLLLCNGGCGCDCGSRGGG